MVATARFLPVKIITDRAKIRAFAKATSPVIRLVDPIIGEKVNSPSTAFVHFAFGAVLLFEFKLAALCVVPASDLCDHLLLEHQLSFA